MHSTLAVRVNSLLLFWWLPLILLEVFSSCLDLLEALLLIWLTLCAFIDKWSVTDIVVVFWIYVSVREAMKLSDHFWWRPRWYWREMLCGIIENLKPVFHTIDLWWNDGTVVPRPDMLTLAALRQQQWLQTVQWLTHSICSIIKYGYIWRGQAASSYVSLVGSRPLANLGLRVMVIGCCSFSRRLLWQWRRLRNIKAAEEEKRRRSWKP